MKIKTVLKVVIFIFILQGSACNHKTNDTDTMKFENEWRNICSATTPADEKAAVEKLINTAHKENAGIGGSYLDKKGNKHNLSDAYILSDINEIESLIIEINITTANQAAKAEEYKNWKPKDINNLRLFLNE